MTHPELVAEIRTELRTVRPDLPPDVAADAWLLRDLALDSLDVVELVARVEEHYRMCVPDDDWQLLRCLDAIADYVLAHR